MAVTIIYFVPQDIQTFWKITNIDAPGRVPAFLDSWWWCAWPKDADLPPNIPREFHHLPGKVKGKKLAYGNATAVEPLQTFNLARF